MYTFFGTIIMILDNNKLKKKTNKIIIIIIIIIIIETLLKSPQKIYLQIFTQSQTKILMKIKISLDAHLVSV